MLKIAFICVHNSFRSQIAEALCRKYASDVFEPYSAVFIILLEVRLQRLFVENTHQMYLNHTQLEQSLEK